jgi:hypothetical protein
MFYKRLLFNRSKIYIAAPKYFCYLRYTHMNIVFVVFTYSRPDNHFVHALHHCIHNFVAFESFGWRKDGSCYCSAGQDGGRIEKAQSSSAVGLAVDRGGSPLSRTLSILHHLDLMVLAFGLILLPVILYSRWACMHGPCKVLFDSAGAGGQDAECLFLFYSSNANTNSYQTYYIKP